MKAKTSETKMLLRIRSVGRRMALKFGSILVAFFAGAGASSKRKCFLLGSFKESPQFNDCELFQQKPKKQQAFL